MNFTQSFEEFSKGLGTTDLILYAGIGLLVWVLFKDKLSPVQNLLGNLLNKLTSKTTQSSVQDKVVVPEVLTQSLQENTDGELFFKLIVSWKQTRDLAVKCGCSKAIEVADTMFPYLSPNVCSKDQKNVEF